MSTSPNATPSEEQINAFLDDELSPEARLAIENAASADPQLKERLRLDAAINDGLRQLFQSALEAPVPARLVNALGPRPWPWWKRLSAAAACVCLGVLIGWNLNAVNAPAQFAMARPLTTEAALAHALYTREGRHAVEVGPDEREHLDRWLSKRLSHKLIAPDLRNNGLKLIGGRMLADAGNPAALYMYEDDEGERITIYVRAHPAPTPSTPPSYTQDRGLEVVHWTEHDMAYAITGRVPRARLQQVVSTAHSQL